MKENIVNDDQPLSAAEKKRVIMVLIGYLYGQVLKANGYKPKNGAMYNTNGFIALEGIKDFLWWRKACDVLSVLIMIMTLLLGIAFFCLKRGEMSPEVEEWVIGPPVILVISLFFVAVVTSLMIPDQGLRDLGIGFRDFIKLLSCQDLSLVIQQASDTVFNEGEKDAELRRQIEGREADKFKERLFEPLWSLIEDTMIRMLQLEKIPKVRSAQALRRRLEGQAKFAQGLGAWVQGPPGSISLFTRLISWADGQSRDKVRGKTLSPLRTKR